MMPQKQILGRASSDKSPTIRSEQKTCGQNTPYMGLVAVFGKKPYWLKIMVKSVWSKKNVHMVFQVYIYVDSPYAIGLLSLTQASYDTTPSTGIKGGFGRCSGGDTEQSWYIKVLLGATLVF